jgi:hypothetical protein
MRRSFERRLRRLEALQINWGEEGNWEEHEAVMEKCNRVFVWELELHWPLAFAKYAEPFLDWYDETFPIEPRGDGHLVATSPRWRLRMCAKAEFEAWWDENCPNDPREDDFHELFEWVIDKLVSRIMMEAVLCTVPVEHRRYFLNPDKWVDFPVYDRPADVERPNYRCCLDIMCNPRGETLKRAKDFAREWARCPDELRSLSVTDERPRSKPLEWFRNRRRSAARASPPRKSRVFTRKQATISASDK